MHSLSSKASIFFLFLSLFLPSSTLLAEAHAKGRKFIILTHYTENIKGYAEHAVRNQEFYAKRFGYKHITEKGIVSTQFSDPAATHPVRKEGLYWQKIASLEKTFENKSKEFDWILWIDSDAIFTNFDQDLDSIVEEYGKGKDLIVPLDAGDKRVRINNGVFLIKNSDWSRKFLHTVGSMYHLYKDDGTPEQDAMRDLIYSQTNGSDFVIKDRSDVILERIPLKNSKDDQFLNHTVVRHRDLYPEELLDPHVAMVQQRVMDSFWRNKSNDNATNAQWKENDFIMHVSELASKEREAILKSVSERLAEQTILDDSINKAFEHCKSHSFSATKIAEILKRTPYNLHMSIKNNVISAPNLDQTKEEGPKAINAMHLLERTKRRFGTLPDLEFVINLLDEHQVPIESDCEPLFSFGTERAKFRDLLFPFPFTYEDLSKRVFEMKTKNITWDEKIDKLVWRGSQTGGLYTEDNWRSKPRSKLVLWCQTHEQQCDAGFSGFSRQVTKQAEEEISKENLIKGRIDENDMQKYKYIASLDGNAWADRLARLLASSSLVLKQESDEIEFWFPLLKPHIHYLPIKHDISDIEEQIYWAKTHQKEVQKIIQNANRLVVDHLTDQKVDRYILRILVTLAHYQNTDHPDPDILKKSLRTNSIDEPDNFKAFQDYLTDENKDILKKIPHDQMTNFQTQLETIDDRLSKIKQPEDIQTILAEITDDKTGMALEHFVSTDNIKILNQLLDDGVKDTFGLAINKAFAMHNFEMAELLLDHEQKHPDGYLRTKDTLWKNIDLLSLLPRIEAGDPYGYILAEAAKLNDMHMVSSLLLHGAKDFYGQALTIAVKQDDTHMLTLLLKHGARDPEGYALVAAARARDIQMVTMLLDHGASDLNGNALAEAARTNNINIATLLLDHGSMDLNGRALYEAAIANKINMVTLLLKRGSTDPHGNALVRAAQNNNIDMVKLLLDHGSKDLTGPALTAAVNKSNIDILKLLLDHGSKDPSGGALELAKKRKAQYWFWNPYGQMIEMLKNVHPDNQNP